MGTKFSGSNAAPEKIWRWAVIPLQKKALQKKALDFCLENQSCDRRQGRRCRFLRVEFLTSPKYELGKVAFGSMFLTRKKSQCFGASSFSK